MISVKIEKRKSSITGEAYVYARAVNHQPMSFADFCDYMSQDSTVGPADVAAVMSQLETKLPLLMSMGVKADITPKGTQAYAVARGSLSQEELKRNLVLRAATGEDVDVDREIKTGDLRTTDVTLSIELRLSKSICSAFDGSAKVRRLSSASVTGGTDGGEDAGGTDGGTGSEGAGGTGGDDVSLG